LIRQHALDDVIAFAGVLQGDAKEAALFSSDLFILPTHSESFGMVIAEALAHELPVLTTTGAPWPALTERAMGWRMPTSVDGLAAGLAEATVLDNIVLGAMGQRGRAFVTAEFGWDGVAQQFLATYTAIIAKSTALSV
jgi:glycosyltransferase involved in cell wall biosynthesis